MGEIMRMPDKEKVIKDLEEVRRFIECENLPAHTLKAKLVIDDALALLKAQEPVAPVRKSFLVSGPGEYGTTPAMTVCGACGAWLLTVEPRAKYCPNCGRTVKWE